MQSAQAASGHETHVLSGCCLFNELLEESQAAGSSIALIGHADSWKTAQLKQVCAGQNHESVAVNDASRSKSVSAKSSTGGPVLKIQTWW
jgi:hypothetical protein